MTDTFIEPVAARERAPRAGWRSSALNGTSMAEARARLALDNPWWEGGLDAVGAARFWPRRDGFDRLFNHAHRHAGREEVGVPPRALIGPRRVGKSVTLAQLVARLIETGIAPARIRLIDVGAPALADLPLDQLAAALADLDDDAPGRAILLIDHLERRVDGWSQLRRLRAVIPSAIIIAASALAPLDDGTGGVSAIDHTAMPPIGFSEWLRLTGAERALIEPMSFGGRTMYTVPDVKALDRAFLAWINGGGFPEAVLRAPGESGGPDHVMRGRVLPALLNDDTAARHGVGGAAELEALFVRLARNTGGEMSIEGLAEVCGLAKNTVRRYLGHLQAAGLIWRMPRVHPAGGRFRRARTFKVHLTAPCLRAALFGPVSRVAETPAMLTETAVIAQWLASRDLANLHFSRLEEGAVDLIGLDPADGRPRWACALVGRDDSLDGRGVEGLIAFAARNPDIKWLGATTATKAALRDHGGREVWHRPASQYCYEVGRRVAEEGVRG